MSGWELIMNERAQVLVVDDEPMIASMMASLLEDEGYRVTCLTSGAAAADYIAGVGRLDALVTDVDLGSEVSGYELAKLLHASRSSAATIFMTGDSADRVRRCVSVESIVLEKPFRPAQLAEALQSLLRSEIQ
jgi:CheY-like chemotaxis protein